MTWLSLAASTVVALVFFGAYARGWSRLELVRGDDAGPYRTAGCLRLQKIVGAIVWGLFALHLAVVWTMTFRTGPVALSHYELWREFLSRPLALGAYVLGIAALGLYLSQGVAASFRAWGLGTRPETSRWLEVGCTLASALTMLLAVNVVSHFATGRAYWSGPTPRASSEATEDLQEPWRVP